MTKVVNFVLFLLFCSFIKRRTGWQSAQRNFVLSILSEKPCLNVYWKLLFWPLCSLNRQQGSFLFVENKQTNNKYLSEGPQITLFLFTGHRKRTGNFLEIFLSLFECIIQTLSVPLSDHYYVLKTFILHFSCDHLNSNKDIFENRLCNVQKKYVYMTNVRCLQQCSVWKSKSVLDRTSVSPNKLTGILYSQEN